MAKRKRSSWGPSLEAASLRAGGGGGSKQAGGGGDAEMWVKRGSGNKTDGLCARREGR